MDFSMIFKKLQTCIKVTRIIMIFQYFSSAHTVDPNKSDNDYNGFLAFLSAYRFGLAAKVTRITMIFQCFFSAHNADLNKSDNNYNAFLVFFTAKELARACKSL